MQKIKAILSDFDGTLVDIDVKYDAAIKPLIKKIQDKSVRFSLATGRAYYSAIKRIEIELGIQGIHILHGGAMIYNSVSDETLFVQAISNESRKKISEYLLKHKIIFSMEARKEVYISEFVEDSRHYPDIKNQLVNDCEDSQEIIKMVIYAKVNRLNDIEISRHIKSIKKECSDILAFKFNFHGYFGVDITSGKATKHTAVLEYLKLLNLSPDEVVAIGDGHNDYPLFTACGFGIAMATAPKELKEIADLVVPAVADGGMVEALKYIYENLT